jgi:hypothetical protein
MMSSTHRHRRHPPPTWLLHRGRPVRGWLIRRRMYGAPFRVDKTPWPNAVTLVAATSEALHARTLEELAAGLASGLALTGRTMPGPTPADEAREIS